jgi:hypothetical protein
VRLVVELAPGDADDAPAFGLERAVAGAVAFERGSGAVGLVAVQLHDEVVASPGEVGFDVVDGGVGERAGEVLGIEEGEPDRLSRRPG